MMVVEFQPEHLKQLMLRTHDKPSFDFFSMILEERTKVCKDDFAFSGISDNNEVIACAGVFKLWEGVGEAWVFGSELIYKYPIWFHKQVIKTLSMIFEKGKFHRIQAIVRSSFFESQEWVERLGFTLEGKLEKYTPEQEDCFIYRMVN